MLYRVAKTFVLLLSVWLTATSTGRASASAPSPALRAENDLFVSSRNTNSVKRYDGETGAYIGDFVAPGSGGLVATQEVAFGPDGHLYVSGRGNDAILKYDGQTGTFLGAFTTGYTLSQPTKMTFGPDGLVYVSQWDPNQPRIARFNATTGAFVDEFPSRDFNQPGGHAWDAEGNLYVAVYGANTVLKFSPEGFLLKAFNNLQGPINVRIDEAGDLLVVDWATGSVKRFDRTTAAFKGTFIMGLTNAEGITLGPDGNMYVCDWQQNRINRYDASTGAFVSTFSSEGGMQQPNSLAFGPPETPTSNETGEAPSRFELYPNYPNPFNPQTLIRYSLPRPTHVTLNVYDVAGREVETLVEARQAAGSYAVRFDASGLPSGLYLYRLDTPAGTLRRSMVLLR